MSTVITTHGVLLPQQQQERMYSGIGTIWRLCLSACIECSFIWSFMSIHITSQATDEVPMMQQQSVQQQKSAPGVGFQPWVQRHTRLTPATHSRHRSLSSSLCTDLQLPEHTHTTLSPLCASCLCWSRGFCSVLPRFWPSKNRFFAGNGWNGYSWLIGLYFLLLLLISLEHTLVFPLVCFIDDRSRGKLDAWVFRLT